MSDSGMDSLRGGEMMDRLPVYYAMSRVMRANIDAQGAELDKLWQALDETLDQHYIAAATWGLELWERELDITVDPAKPVEQRRSVILSKVRGIGNVTAAMVRSVAEAFDGGAVDVVTLLGQYCFRVKFVDTLGVPHNLGDLKSAIEELKPAHLGVVYEYKYLLINQVQAMTLNEIQSRKLTDFAPFIPV